MSCDPHFEKHHSRMRTKAPVLMIQLDSKTLFLSLSVSRKHVSIVDYIARDLYQLLL